MTPRLRQTTNNTPSEHSTSDHDCPPDAGADVTDFTTLVAEMVADQAPRLFAVVVEFGGHIDGKIVAWGMALNEHTYMTTADGSNQYVLAGPNSALRYVRSHPETTPHLVWVTPSVPSHDR